MEIEVRDNSLFPINSSDTEIVERKGIGHPDTLADLVAEEFSRRYARFCLDHFGVIANHSADKVMLIGGSADLWFGGSRLITPMRACLVGKVTQRIGSHIIPVDDLFAAAVTDVFTRVVGPEVVAHVVFQVDVVTHVGLDHPSGFYNPKSIAELQQFHADLRSNDTVVCVATGGYSNLERLVIDMENTINGPDLKGLFPDTGVDVKIMARRVNASIDVTACVPFKASLVPSKARYRSRVQELKTVLWDWLERNWDGTATLHLNTKDDDGRYAFLTAFGTALDKGDSGAVGRGNRFNGLITPNRAMSIEAPAGKNPIHHSGKVYAAVSFSLAMEIDRMFAVENMVTICARNGDPLDRPSHIEIRTVSGLNDRVCRSLREMAHQRISHPGLITTELINNDPIASHRGTYFNTDPIKC